MGNFSIPIKQIITNGDVPQITVVDNSVAGAVGSFALRGWLNQTNASQLELLAAALRMRVTAGVVGAVEVTEFTFTLGAADGDVVIVRETTIDLTPTEFQNQPVDKRYQIPLGADATAVATAVAAAINADPFSKVTATDAAGVLTLTAKEVGSTFDVYTGEGNITLSELPAKTVTTAASLGTGNYNTLKNIEWAKNVEHDRNLEYYPTKGSLYNQYYFEVNWNTVDLGGHDVPSLLPAAGKTAFQVWAQAGTQINTDMAALATALNV